jgi:hypothetical protein
METWGKAYFKSQPLDKVRDYFGEELAFYFAWLGFYTTWLAPAAVIGIIAFGVGYPAFSASSSFVVVLVLFVLLLRDSCTSFSFLPNHVITPSSHLHIPLFYLLLSLSPPYTLSLCLCPSLFSLFRFLHLPLSAITT